MINRSFKSKASKHTAYNLVAGNKTPNTFELIISNSILFIMLN